MKSSPSLRVFALNLETDEVNEMANVGVTPASGDVRGEFFVERGCVGGGVGKDGILRDKRF